MYFNSIKVRLELDNTISQVAYEQFQFHKGTIRTCRTGHRLTAAMYFNSIKVRLEREQVAFDNDFVVNFNSIKVRLEQNELHHAADEIIFQFHKGTIRTRIGRTKFRSYSISIP